MPPFVSRFQPEKLLDGDVSFDYTIFLKPADGEQNSIVRIGHTPSLKDWTISFNSQKKTKIDTFSRIALSIALVRILVNEGIFPIHASGIVRNGYGVLVPGDSGAGKSTFSRYCQQKNIPILSDEICSIFTSNAGTAISSGPNWGKILMDPEFLDPSPWDGSPCPPVPLASIYYLGPHSQSGTRADSLSQGDSFLRLLHYFQGSRMAHAISNHEQLHHHKIINSLANFARCVPAFELAIDLNHDPLPQIEKAIPPPGLTSPLKTSTSRLPGHDGLFYGVEIFPDRAFLCRLPDLSLFEIPIPIARLLNESSFAPPEETRRLFVSHLGEHFAASFFDYQPEIFCFFEHIITKEQEVI